MFDLQGKTALVTGATGGIGEAIAKALHARGARVAISGTRQEKLDALKAEMGGDTVAIAANLSDKEDVLRLAREAEEQLGQVDILVANAGITRDNLAMRMKDEEWSDVLDVNLTSSFVLMRALLRGMMKRKYGRMIAISSVVGVSGNPGQVNYAASKAGLIGMCKSMAQEIASRGITVNAIAPGFIRTPMTDALNEEQQKRITDSIPAQDFGLPEDIAAAAVYLASDEARYMTGQTLHVNGGMLMV